MADNYNQLVMLNEALLETPFQHACNYRVEFGDLPAELAGTAAAKNKAIDLYTTGVTYTPIEVAFDPWTVGANTLQFPKTAESVSLNVPLREHEDGRVRKWIQSWMDEFILPDGTQRAAFQYVREMSVYQVGHDGQDTGAVDRFNVLPQSLGVEGFSDEDEALLLLPTVFMQMRSLGG